MLLWNEEEHPNENLYGIEHSKVSYGGGAESPGLFIAYNV